MRLGVPCAVLVRRPLEAITSLVIFERGRLADAVALRGYIGFHRAVAPHRDRIAICDFDELLADPAVLVERINRRYGTGFHSAPMDDAQKRELLGAIERFHVHRDRSVATYSVPSAAKETAKPAVRERLAAHPLLARAEDAYRVLLEGRTGG